MPVDPFNPQCEGMNFSVQLPTLRCDASIMPDFANIQNFGRQLGSIPGTLGNMAVCLVAEKAAQLRAAIQRILDLFDRIFASMPLPLSVENPVFRSLRAIELEMELRLTALYNEFKLFWQNLVIGILTKIPGLAFITQLLQVPIPFLGGPVLADIFTTEGRARIREAVGRRVQAIANALGMPANMTWNGVLGIFNLEAQIQNILSRIWQVVQNMITNILQAAFNVLTRLTQAIQQIWRALGLPLIPTLQAFDLSALFTGIWENIVRQVSDRVEQIRRAVDAILNFDLGDWLRSSFGALLRFIPWPFPTQIRQLLDAIGGILDREFNLRSPEVYLNRIMTAVQQLVTNILNIIIELWLQLVVGFIRAILRFFPILEQLLKLIPFTFCTFLNMVAAPLFGLSSQVAGLIPSTVSTSVPSPQLPPTPTM